MFLPTVVTDQATSGASIDLLTKSNTPAAYESVIGFSSVAPSGHSTTSTFFEMMGSVASTCAVRRSPACRRSK